MARKNVEKKLLPWHVAGTLDYWQPGILRESRICHGELAKVELGTSVGRDNSRVFTLDAKADSDCVAFDLLVVAIQIAS